MTKTIAYLCLQATRQGQASYAHVHEIIAGLEKRGWEVILFEPGYATKNAMPGMAGRAWAFLTLQFRMWRLKQRIDLLYIRSHFAAFPSSVWARINHVPQVLEINGPYEDLFIAWPWTRFFAPVFRLMLKTEMRFADAAIAVTPQLAEWVTVEAKRERVFVVPNGANTKLFSPTAKSNRPVDDPYVIFFGALAAWQGVEVLLQALQEPSWPPEVQLVVVGDGAKRPIVEERAKKDPRLVYLGKKPYAEVPALVAGAMAGICPMTDVEGRSATGLFPLKLFETLACGVPAIVTDFPGQGDLVREIQCGIVVSPGSPEELAAAVAKLHSNPIEVRNMGLRGRNAVEAEHSWDARAEKTFVILKSVGVRGK